MIGADSPTNRAFDFSSNASTPMMAYDMLWPILPGQGRFRVPAKTIHSNARAKHFRDRFGSADTLYR